LRKETYDDAGLDTWVKNLDRLASSADEVFVYFKHETSAPDLASRLRAKLDRAT
jgi:uncharacterized protein YecE (DUF72 family)